MQMSGKESLISVRTQKRNRNRSRRDVECKGMYSGKQDFVKNGEKIPEPIGIGEDFSSHFSQNLGSQCAFGATRERLRGIIKFDAV